MVVDDTEVVEGGGIVKVEVAKDEYLNEELV
jgi:hypothetical protein